MEIENINVGKEEGLSELEKEHLASERFDILPRL